MKGKSLFILVAVIAGLLGIGILVNGGQFAGGGGHGAGFGTSSGAAIDFTLPRLDGGNISLAEYRGDKPVVLDFWASWCHNCRRDMPKLSKMYDKYSDQVEVIGVNLREPASTASGFVNNQNISFPIAMDSRGTVSNSYGIRFTNTHILIDKEGNIVKTIPGDIKEADIVRLINS